MQGTLPLIPSGATRINKKVSVDRHDLQWTYYINLLPVYVHASDDHDHFRFVIAQLVVADACRPCEIIATFGVTKNKVMRAARQLRERGARSFFEPRKSRRSGTVLTPDKLKSAQQLLDGGAVRSDVASELDVRPDTLRKAINDGRLTEHPAEPPSSCAAKTMSERSGLDGAAAEEMGTACTRPDERVYAALGLSNGAPMHFERCLDVPFGGVLCALPGLVSNGLLTGIAKLGQVSGYYTRIQVLLVFAVMCLCRIRTIEKLRRYPPGELGKLIGLDRIPEARCLRAKADQLAGSTEADEWAATLSRQWMEQSLAPPGFLYIDGHVKVYSGGEKLPRRFVSRQRLCLRGISNYWVNDALGRPFFVVERQIDDGLLQTLRRDIVPRLLDEVPRQPAEEELNKNPLLCRFVIVFDREGYSPAFFREMWEEHRIACITYRKSCKENWPIEWFKEVRSEMPRGETVVMQLAERGALLGSGGNAVWVKEVRKLTKGGHQTSIVSTAYDLESTVIAPHMFTRWCQENFFAYAMHHFPIDILTEYGKEPFGGTDKVVNPVWRETERQRNSAKGKLDCRRAKFVAMDSEAAADPGHPRHEKWETRKAELLEDMQCFDAEVDSLARKKKTLAHYITWDELPEEEKFMKLPSSRRRLINTVGMIAYRAETAMASLLCNCDKQLPFSDARSLLQALFATHADILPDTTNNIIEVRLHTASTPAANRRLAMLVEQLNETETTYPGTNLTMFFSLMNYPA